MKQKLASLLIILLLLIIMFGLFSFAMFQGDFVSWFLFFSFLPICLYSMMMLVYPANSWQITRRISKSIAYAGEDVIIHIRLNRKIPIPIHFMVCEEILPNSLARNIENELQIKYANGAYKLKKQMKRIIFPMFKRQIDINYIIADIPRGEHELSAIRLYTSDIFGFVKKEYIYPLAESIIVYPKLRLLEIGKHAHSSRQGTVATQALYGENITIPTGIREYIPGDQLSRIDWKQTARKQTIMTRELAQEKGIDPVVIMNSCYSENISLKMFEHVIEVTFGLIETLGKQTDQVRFISNAEAIVSFQVSKYQMAEKYHLLSHLMTIEPFYRSIEASVIDDEMTKLGRNSSFIIVTMQLDHVFIKLIEQISRTTQQIAIVYVYDVLTDHTSAQINELRKSGLLICLLATEQFSEAPIEVVFT